MPKKQSQPEECKELCSSCAIDKEFALIEQQPLRKQIDLVLQMWNTTYSNEIHTVASLFAWTTHTSQRWADKQQPVKKRTAKLQVAA